MDKGWMVFLAVVLFCSGALGWPGSKKEEPVAQTSTNALAIEEIKAKLDVIEKALNGFMVAVSQDRQALQSLSQRIDGVVENHNRLIGGVVSLEQNMDNRGNQHQQAIILMGKAMEMEFGEAKWKSMLDAARARIEAENAVRTANEAVERANEAAKKVEKRSSTNSNASVQAKTAENKDDGRKDK